MGGDPEEPRSADAAFSGVPQMTKNRENFTLTAVEPLGGSRLRLAFADGAKLTVDLADWIASTKALQPLSNKRLFATARIGSFGRTVEFGD